MLMFSSHRLLMLVLGRFVFGLGNALGLVPFAFERAARIAGT